jgi:hypothetical protein
MKRTIVLILVALGAISLPAHAGPSYSYTTIDVPGAGASAATAINNAGDIVGAYGSGNEAFWGTPEVPLHGFVLSHGGFSTYDAPGTIWTSPQDITDAGAVLGHYGQYDEHGYAYGPVHGFRFDRGQTQTLDVPGYPFTFLTDANDQGRAVGFSVGGDNIARGFFMDGTGFTPIAPPGTLPDASSYVTAISETGLICIYSSGTWYRGRPGALVPIVFPAGATPSQITGMNNRGDVVGTYLDAFGAPRGFILRGSELTVIALPGADATEPKGVNERGDVVGRYYRNGETHAFLAKV